MNMVAEEVDKLEKLVTKLYKNLGSFRMVALALDMRVKDIIYILKADRKSKLKHFRSVQNS